MDQLCQRWRKNFYDYNYDQNNQYDYNQNYNQNYDQNYDQNNQYDYNAGGYNDYNQGYQQPPAAEPMDDDLEAFLKSQKESTSQPAAPE